MAAQGRHQGVVADTTNLQGHKGHNRLSLEVIGSAHHCSLSHRWMADQGRFNLHGAQPVSRDVDDVVNPAHHPEVAVAIPPGPITGEIEGGAIGGAHFLPIALAEAVGIAMDGAHHSGPRPTNRQVAPLVGPLGVAIVVNDVGHDAWQGQGGRSRLGGGGPRQGADHHPTGFGLPPGVHDGATATANHLLVPDPGFWVDRLPHRAQDSQGAHVVLVRHLPAALHEGPNCCRCCVKEGHLVLLNHLPKGAGLARAGSPLVHHRGGAIGEGAIHDVAVARNPAHIRGAPMDVVLADVENPLEGEVGPEVVARCGVNHTLGFSGGSGGVEHKQPVFTGHRLGWAIGGLGAHQLMPPMVAAGLHRGATLDPLHHQHRLH